MTKELKNMSQLQAQVLMLLPEGMDRLVSTTDIENILHLDKRHIMGIIEELILEYGIPIGSLRDKNRYGYFIATTEEEKVKGTLSVIQQANSMKRRVEKVMAADFETASLYKEKYKEKEMDYDKQLDLFYLFRNDAKIKDFELEKLK